VQLGSNSLRQQGCHQGYKNTKESRKQVAAWGDQLQWYPSGNLSPLIRILMQRQRAR
jgi:hypothetical protein